MKNWQANTLIVLLNLLLVVLLWNVLVGPPKIAPKWAYRVEQIREEKISRKLDHYGAQGWEVVVARRIRGAHSFDVVLKKPR